MNIIAISYLVKVTIRKKTYMEYLYIASIQSSFIINYQNTSKIHKAIERRFIKENPLFVIDKSPLSWTK